MNQFTKKSPLPHTNTLFCEKQGLDELRIHQISHGLRVPQILSVNSQKLILEKIYSTAPTLEQWRALGEGLFKLHSLKMEFFGYESSNFIGLNPQENSPTNNWGEFFYQHRLLFQINLIKDDPIKAELLSALPKCKTPLVEFLNAHNPQPSIVHGDLWSGNVMFSKEGPWLIDPAIYYGDREVDLAMTKIFGGFSEEFYAAYFLLYKKPKGFAKREVIYNLYHYLNHYNLFGESYLSPVRQAFKVLSEVTS